MRKTLVLAASLALCLPALAQETAETPQWPEPEISDDISALPEPVRAKRQALIDAARSGDIEELRALVEAQASPPNVSFGNPEDAVDYLKDASEDDDGRQILGLLIDLFDQPYAFYPDSGGQTNYIWPYLAELPPDSLTPEQQVDAYRLLDSAQIEELKQFGAWYYWRTVINEAGDWSAFVAGD
ncbi:hypothetical protein [Devosia chinhatensis]|uniref:hypothetical protein n=1 Tax=Devosia chinhatensis TaxID=429727 RepID=UPI000697672B|nr:hypothetical protein [Devosia chinhatensis]